MLKRFARRALGCLCICLIGIAILMLLGAWLIKREIPIAIANGIKESTDWTLAYDKVETRLLDLAFEAEGGTLTSGDPAQPRVTIDIGSARLDLRHDDGDRLAIEEFDLRIAAIHLPSTDGTALDRLYEGLMPLLRKLLDRVGGAAGNSSPLPPGRYHFSVGEVAVPAPAGGERRIPVNLELDTDALRAYGDWNALRKGVLERLRKDVLDKAATAPEPRDATR